MREGAFSALVIDVARRPYLLLWWLRTNKKANSDTVCFVVRKCASEKTAMEDFRSHDCRRCESAVRI